MKFLVPTDFSKNASNAIAYASVLAKAFKAELVFIHVYVPQVSKKNSAYRFISEEIALALKDATAKMDQLCLEASAEYGISSTCVALAGSPVEQIVSHADVMRADLIIMGTQGATGLDQIFFGSNTTSVIQRSDRTVLAIPSHTKPILPQKIVFATDYHKSDLQTLKRLAAIAVLVNAEIVVLHVTKKEAKSDRDMIEEFTKEVSRETGLPQPFYYVMSHEDTRKGIELFVESTGADLISMSTRRRSTLSKLFDTSKTQQMASEARLPVLAFHVT